MVEASANSATIRCKVQFSGGLEMYFNNERELSLELTYPQGGKYTVSNLIEKLRTAHMSDKEEMFVQAGTVRPGIIVLINDTDWELEGQTEYEIENNDTIAFISTLHGG